MNNKYKIDDISKPAALKETMGNKIAKFLICFISFTVLLFIVWACFAKIDEVSVASGSIIPKQRTKVVQSLKSGIVEKIFVENGDHVKKGQVLLKLESVQSFSFLDEVNMQIQSLLGRKIRIKALLSDKKPDFSEISNSEILDIEKELYDIIKNSNMLQNDLINNQIEQLHSNVAQLEIQKKTLVEQMQFLNEEILINQKLLKKGAVPKVRLLRMNRDKSDLNHELLPYDEEIAKAVKRIAELNISLSQTNVDFKKDLRLELEDINHELIELKKRKDRFVDDYQKNYIKSPASGIVHHITKFTVGGTVEPNEVFMKIVPDKSQLIAKVKINPIDIGHIEVGQNANIKMVTFDFSRFGDIDGKIVKISPTAVSTVEDYSSEEPNAQSLPEFDAIIELSQDYITVNHEKKFIQPGMSVIADIKTGEKTLIEYLLKPIFISLNQALRER